jgi:hypothetical protein
VGERQHASFQERLLRLGGEPDMEGAPGVRQPYHEHPPRDLIEDWNGPLDFRSEQARPINAALARNRTVFYTPQVQSNIRAGLTSRGHMQEATSARG